MTIVSETAIVSCYADSAALLVVILLLLLSERIRQRRTVPLRIFFLLSCTVTVTCIFCFFYNAMYKSPAPWSHTVALAARTLRCYAVILIILLLLILMAVLQTHNL